MMMRAPDPPTGYSSASDVDTEDEVVEDKDVELAAVDNHPEDPIHRRRKRRRRRRPQWQEEKSALICSVCRSRSVGGADGPLLKGDAGPGGDQDPPGAVASKARRGRHPPRSCGYPYKHKGRQGDHSHRQPPEAQASRQGGVSNYVTVHREGEAPPLDLMERSPGQRIVVVNCPRLCPDTRTIGGKLLYALIVLVTGTVAMSAIIKGAGWFLLACVCVVVIYGCLALETCCSWSSVFCHADKCFFRFGVERVASDGSENDATIPTGSSFLLSGDPEDPSRTMTA